MIGRVPSPWQRTFFIKSPLFLSYSSNHFSFHISFFPPAPSLLCCWVLFDRKYSRRCGGVVDLRPWQTPSIRLICIRKSIGYLTLANTLGSGRRRCWVGPVTLSLVMELWWSVTALHGCWLRWRTVKNDALLLNFRLQALNMESEQCHKTRAVWKQILKLMTVFTTINKMYRLSQIQWHI